MKTVITEKVSLPLTSHKTRSTTVLRSRDLQENENIIHRYLLKITNRRVQRSNSRPVGVAVCKTVHAHVGHHVCLCALILNGEVEQSAGNEGDGTV